MVTNKLTVIAKTVTTTRQRGRAAVENRKRILLRDCGLCLICQRLGLLTVAVEVDHIIALVNGGSDDDSNKQSLCKACHQLKTAEDLGYTLKAGSDESGFPTNPNHHWNR